MPTLTRPFIFACLLVLMVPLFPAATTAQDVVIGPDTYPDGINPLTGLPADDPNALNRRPLLIKITNFPPVVRDYQIGLNDAEIVWEHLLSGGVTRFSAIFLENDYEKIGPVRSGRLVDFELTRIYRSLFAYSGMSQGTIEVLFGDALVSERVVGGSGPCPPLCRYPQEGLALEHTLFGDTEQIRTDFATERDADTTPDPVYGMAFSDDAPPGGTPLDYAQVRYTQSVVGWEWNAAAERWLRVQDGDPHWDTSQDKQVQAANVVIIEDEHTVQPYVSEQYWGPANFAFSVNLIGSGRAYMLRDGTLYQGEWRRESRDEPLTFFDADGDVLPFKPGNSFFNLVPMWTDGYELELLPAEPETITVNGETGVSMRFGPDDAYVAPDVAYPGDEFNVIGRDFYGEWLQLKRGDERAIWLPVERLNMTGLDADALPNPRPSHER